jgi:hypothetical protein
MPLTFLDSGGTNTKGLVLGSISIEPPPVVQTSWEILLRYNGKKVTAASWTASLLRTNIGNPGTTLFRSASITSTTASSRTTFGDSQGLYPAFFNKTGISRIAFVDGTSNSTDPTTHTNYLIYDLVQTSGTESIYGILDRLDKFQQTASNFANNDSLVWTGSSTRFHSAGINGYSGLLVASGGTSFRTNTTPASYPTRFVVMGINLESDNDIQALCAFTGSLSATSGKGDAWRNDNPLQTFWSYWGNDFHTNSQTQRIGSSLQTTPGVPTGATYTGSVYLLAF